MRAFLAFATGLAFVTMFAPPVFADDTAVCAYMTQVVTETNTGAPYMVDTITRAEPATLDCTGKNVSFNWSILLGENGLNPDWHDALKANFENNFCSEPQFVEALRTGWKIIASWKTEDGAGFATEVTCP
jgi:hypothetical protein